MEWNDSLDGFFSKISNIFSSNIYAINCENSCFLFDKKGIHFIDLENDKECILIDNKNISDNIITIL